MTLLHVSILLLLIVIKFLVREKRKIGVNFIIKMDVSNIKFKIITCVIYIYKYIDHNINNFILYLDTI